MKGWVLVSSFACVLGCNDSHDSVWEGDDGATSSDSSNPSGGDAASAEASGGGDGGDSSESGDEADTDETKLDVAAPDGEPGGGCGCDLTYIWVANSEEGTVSKINTRTVEEEGRYITRPDGNGDPSRTSVNLEGDVAVANRYGGLAKFIADTDNCVESNGMPGIQTSTGPDDILPWDVEECRAWYTDFDTTNQRPVAWTGGQVGPDSCDASEAKVWTVTSANPGLAPGLGGAGGAIAYLVRGANGSVEETIPVDNFPGGNLGAYGGAVDGHGNLWFTSMGFSGGKLARVDRQSYDVEIVDIPAGIGPYGITVDHEGRVWLSSLLGSGAGRYDHAAGTWDTVSGFFGGSGLAEGPDNQMYVSAGNSVHAVDMDSLAVGESWSTDESVKGVGFDADGFLWAVTWVDPKDPGPNAGVAFKVDPGTMTVNDFYPGLTFPYTYSDMTGSALSHVNCPPEG